MSFHIINNNFSNPKPFIYDFILIILTEREMIDQFSIIYACVEGMQNYYKALIQ